MDSGGVLSKNNVPPTVANIISTTEEGSKEITSLCLSRKVAMCMSVILRDV